MSLAAQIDSFPTKCDLHRSVSFLESNFNKQMCYFSCQSQLDDLRVTDLIAENLMKEFELCGLVSGMTK